MVLFLLDHDEDDAQSCIPANVQQLVHAVRVEFTGAHLCLAPSPGIRIPALGLQDSEHEPVTSHEAFDVVRLLELGIAWSRNLVRLEDGHRFAWNLDSDERGKALAALRWSEAPH